MSLSDAQNSPFAIVVGRLLPLDDASMRMIEDMEKDKSRAIRLGFYSEHESESLCLIELWGEAVRMSRMPALVS